MAARIQLNNFRFSIYIDADGTVTLTDLPSELREVVEALDPDHTWGALCPVPQHPQHGDGSQDTAPRENIARDNQREDDRG